MYSACFGIPALALFFFFALGILLFSNKRTNRDFAQYM